MSLLQTVDLCRSFGEIRAVDQLSMTVRSAVMTGFVGANGAGKTTTMRMVVGVLEPTSGQVLWDGHSITTRVRRQIGYMPEERGLYLKQPVIDQLVYLGTLKGYTTNRVRVQVMEYLERFGLADRAKDKLTELSLGNQQRVQLAASLIHDPDILILDEPFSGLDPVAVDVMSTMLTDRARAGVPVIFSSHQLDLVQRLCDRIGIVTRGRMVAEGTVDELRDQGPIRYRVGTTARGWLPEGVALVHDSADHVVLEAQSVDDDQRILQSAMAAGPVHEFTRVVPDLADLGTGCLYEPRCLISRQVCRVEHPDLLRAGTRHLSRCFFHGETPAPGSAARISAAPAPVPRAGFRTATRPILPVPSASRMRAVPTAAPWSSRASRWIAAPSSPSHSSSSGTFCSWTKTARRMARQVSRSSVRSIFMRNSAPECGDRSGTGRAPDRREPVHRPGA